MWTEIARAQYARAGRRHASDLDDAEWGPIEPDTPRRKPLGRRRRVALRAVVNAILHACRAGCPWRMLPTDGRDTYALVKSGIMRGASIEFHAIDERVSRERDKPLVEVLEARLERVKKSLHFGLKCDSVGFIKDLRGRTRCRKRKVFAVCARTVSRRSGG